MLKNSYNNKNSGSAGFALTQGSWPLYQFLHFLCDNSKLVCSASWAQHYRQVSVQYDHLFISYCAFCAWALQCMLTRPLTINGTTSRTCYVQPVYQIWTLRRLFLSYKSWWHSEAGSNETITWPSSWPLTFYFRVFSASRALCLY